MQIDVLDTAPAIAGILASEPADRPDGVRALWEPVRGMYRFAPGLDLADAHRGTFGFPFDGPTEELSAGLRRLEDADAWGRVRTALDEAAARLGPDAPLPDRLRVLIVLGDPTDAHYLHDVEGLSAFGGFSGFIVLTLWPTDAVLDRIEAIAAHELHHNARYSPGGVVWNPATVTLGEQVVAEGLADAFARERYGDQGPTHFARSVRGDRAVLEKVAGALGTTGMQHFGPWILGDASARHFGQQPVGVPTGAGYAAGLSLVDAYLPETGTTAAGSVATPADEILGVALPALGLAG